MFTVTARLSGSPCTDIDIFHNPEQVFPPQFKVFSQPATRPGPNGANDPDFCESKTIS